MANDDLRVEIDEHIEAPPTEAFEYLADPERRPFAGDRIELGDEILRETPRRIAWETTITDGDSRRAGTVEVAIAPGGAGSRVRVTHRIGSPFAGASLALAA